MFAWAARGKKKDLKLNSMETLSEFCNNRVVPMPAVQTSGYDAGPFGDMGQRISPENRNPPARTRQEYQCRQHLAPPAAFPSHTKQFAILQK